MIFGVWSVDFSGIERQRLGIAAVFGATIGWFMIDLAWLRWLVCNILVV